jgi:hypothetical protein
MSTCKNTNFSNFKQGIVKIKNHPIFKFGQVVTIIDETSDLYIAKAHPNCKPSIISKEDIRLN